MQQLIELIEPQNFWVWRRLGQSDRSCIFFCIGCLWMVLRLYIRPNVKKYRAAICVYSEAMCQLQLRVSLRHKTNDNWEGCKVTCDQQRCTGNTKTKQLTFTSLSMLFLELTEIAPCSQHGSSSNSSSIPPLLCTCSQGLIERDGGWDMDMESCGGRQEERTRKNQGFCVILFHRGDREPRWYNPIELPYKNLLPFTCIV